MVFSLARGRRKRGGERGNEKGGERVAVPLHFALHHFSLLSSSFLSLILPQRYAVHARRRSLGPLAGRQGHAVRRRAGRRRQRGGAAHGIHPVRRDQGKEIELSAFAGSVPYPFLVNYLAWRGSYERAASTSMRKSLLWAIKKGPRRTRCHRRRRRRRHRRFRRLAPLPFSALSTSSSLLKTPDPPTPPPKKKTPELNSTHPKKQDVSIPIDNATGAHRGFGFVEFEEENDAAAAALNMDAAEFFGRTLRVNQSQSRIGGANKRDAVWADGDAWNERAEAGDVSAAAGDASGAFKRQEVGGGGGGGGGGGAAAAARRQQPSSASLAADDPMAAAEAALG